MNRAESALISVYNKEGISEFGFNIYASGGTAHTIREAGIDVTDVADLMGGGPILGHRVVTLSREIHAGRLANTKKNRKTWKSLSS